MSGGHHVETAELRGYADLLARQAQHFTTIAGHATDKGGDVSGYTGLLALLAPVVTGVVNLYTGTLDFANGKMTEVHDNLVAAADQYDAREDASRSDLENLGRVVDTSGDFAIGGV